MSQVEIPAMPGMPQGKKGRVPFVSQQAGRAGEQSPAPASGAAPQTLPQAAQNDQSKSNATLFSAMDAPLSGLMPDDLAFTGEVEAALARKPRFGARALSLSVAVMFAGLILWAALADIDEVASGEGQVVGAQRTQTIQNLEGGILRSILVHEGQTVDKGHLLAQIDNEVAASAHRDAVNRAMENSLATIRLQGELDETQTPAYPQDLAAWAVELTGSPPDAALLEHAREIIRDQEQARLSRRDRLKADLDVLRSQYDQRRHEVAEQSAHKKQLDLSLVLALDQRNSAKVLFNRGNYSRLEYLGLEQRVVEMQGQIAMLASALPRARAAEDEALQRMASREAEQQSAIVEEINKRRLELNSLRETLAAGGDRVTRTELRAPVRSSVRQIYLNTVGGVVKPGEPIMDLVPLDDTLLVEARVQPKDVAFLRPGQEVMVKVSAYDFSIYGGLEGRLETISADTIEDKRGGYYYLVKVRTSQTSIRRSNEELPIIPGMMVTADILIGKKTVLDYLLKPILKAKQNSLRER
jgi:adhesin transport system membrane fusion protein